MNILNAILSAAGFAVIATVVSAAQLEIDPKLSKIEVAISCTMDSFVGKLDQYQATVECDPTAVLPARADFSFDFAELKTGNKDRDIAVLKWPEYPTNRTAPFHLTGWQEAGTNNIALGQLTIHGVTLAVQMPAIVKPYDTSWDISGQTAFDCHEFKLSKIRKALVLAVDPKSKVKFHLVGKIVSSK